MNKIKPKKIILCRAEGRESQLKYNPKFRGEPISDPRYKREGADLELYCSEYAEVGNFKESNKVLRDWSLSAPKTGAYDKTDFVVVFGKDDIYMGRYDLQHPSIDMADLPEHIRDFAEYYSGRKKPHWMDEEQYKISLSRFDQEDLDYWNYVLDNYDLNL